MDRVGVRAEAGGYRRLYNDDVYGSCVVYQVPGPGKSTRLFTLMVEAARDEPLNWIGDEGTDPFYDLAAGADERDYHVTDEGALDSDLTNVADRRPEPHPLGDGTLGHYTNRFTTVRAVCGAGSDAQAPTVLHVTARADYDDVSGEDRDRIARLARSAARKLADRVGCRTELPELPDELESAPDALRPARTTGGSCRWFGEYLGEQGQGRLPDRALATPVRDGNPAEGCLLAVSPDKVRRTIGTLGNDHRMRTAVEGALTYSPWWVRTVSYFGPEARRVAYDDLWEGDQAIRANTAGAAGGAWWASSICDGAPALHAMSLGYPYDQVLGAKALSSLFHAYVDDITKRRGCTHVRYPKKSASGDR